MKRKCPVVSNTFRPLNEIKFSCNRYFTSISTGNVCCSSFLITTALKCKSEVKLKRIRTELLNEKTFFYFSVKDLFNFGKNKEYGTYLGPVNFA